MNNDAPLYALYHFLNELEAQARLQQLPPPKVRFQTHKTLRHQSELFQAQQQADGSWLISLQDLALHGYAGVLPESWVAEIHQLDHQGHTALSDFIDALIQRSRECAYQAAKTGQLKLLLEQKDSAIEHIFQYLLQQQALKNISLEQKIAQTLGIQVTLERYCGVWQTLPKPQHYQLGYNAVLGGRYLEVDKSLSVKLKKQDQQHRTALADLLKQILGNSYAYRIDIIESST